jgi:hypothetical protein
MYFKKLKSKASGPMHNLSIGTSDARFLLEKHMEGGRGRMWPLRMQSMPIYQWVRRQRDRGTERQRDRGIERQRDRETEGQRDRGTEGQRDRETEGHKRQRDRETERHKEQEKKG